MGKSNAETFCDRLTKLERQAGRITMDYKYTLPTKEQWEYACRAGTTTGLNNGKELKTSWLDTDANLDEVAWYKGNSDGQLHEVGQKLPNAWGLYDMHGNVAEYYQGSSSVCGGGYSSSISNCRSASYSGTGGNLNSSYGFRIVLVPVK